MLRAYFLYHRELLGELARLAYETVREMMAAAIDVDVNDARPGMVAVIQTFGSSLRWNPHSDYLALLTPLFSVKSLGWSCERSPSRASFPVRLSRSMIIRISGESRSERRISHGA